MIYSEMILIKTREAERVAVNRQRQAPQRNRHLSLRSRPLPGAHACVYLLQSSRRYIKSPLCFSKGVFGSSAEAGDGA